MRRKAGSSVSQELEVVAPSKLAIDNVSKSFDRDWPGAGARSRELEGERRRIRLSGRRERLRKDDTAQSSSPAWRSRTAERSWPTANQSSARARTARHVSGSRALPVAGRLGNVIFGLKLKPNLKAQDRPRCREVLSGIGWTDQIRARKHSRTFRRHETTRSAGPRARTESARAVDG